MAKKARAAKKRSAAKNKLPELIEFSQDLLEAAKRSTGPLSKLDDKGRHYVLERYRKFLALAKQHPRKPLAPTADIDEMWHIHMLMPRAYAKDCTAYFGEILDHNGGFGREPRESQELSRVFDKTAALWTDAFGQEYLADSGTASPLPLCFSAASQAAAYCITG